jgi:hypothetical protein
VYRAVRGDQPAEAGARIIGQPGAQAPAGGRRGAAGATDVPQIAGGQVVVAVGRQRPLAGAAGESAARLLVVGAVMRHGFIQPDGPARYPPLSVTAFRDRSLR